MTVAQADVLALNSLCGCLPLDPNNIRAEIVAQWPSLSLAPLLEERSALFAGSGVFLSPKDLAQMQAVVDAVEAAARLPAYLAMLSERNPSLASRLAMPTRGLFMGYDFHLSAEGPRLIEINTNAGGAGLVTALQQVGVVAGAQCMGARLFDLAPDAASAIAASIRSEWRLSGRTGEPSNIAIVDVAPDQEYLYPDMLLLQALLAEQGLDSALVPASQLRWDGKGLSAAGRPVDMVYNRLTDFALELEVNEALRQAWLADGVVVSPGPEHHLRYADKRNLVTLSQPNHPVLQGLDSKHREALSRIPPTEQLQADTVDALWHKRKGLFFKPISGFAGRGAYRGNKLTKKTWREMQQRPYVAQALVPPALRLLGSAASEAGLEQLLKFDVRLFTYAGEPLLLAARAYQGQTTNFRTPGGGFAPVFECR